MQQCNQYSTTRATKRVAQCDGATSRVDIVDAEVENFGIGFDDSSKGFVELPDGNVRLGEAGLFQELLDDGGGGNGEVDGVCIR